MASATKKTITGKGFEIRFRATSINLSGGIQFEKVIAFNPGKNEVLHPVENINHPFQLSSGFSTPEVDSEFLEKNQIASMVMAKAIAEITALYAIPDADAEVTPAAAKASK